jgi:hypothetical protein
MPGSVQAESQQSLSYSTRSGESQPVRSELGVLPAAATWRDHTGCGSARPGGALAAVRCQWPTPPIPRVQHRRVAVFALLALAAVALQASFHEPTGSGSMANVGLGDGPPGSMQAGPLEVELALQNKPVASPTARIRYDIPGWDSIRRTATTADVSTVETARQLPPAPVHGPEYVPFRVLFGLLVPALGWVGLPLALRYIAWWAYAPAGGTKGSPGALLIALSKMAEDQTHTDCDHGAHEGPSTGSCVADPKRGAPAGVLLRQRVFGDITLIPALKGTVNSPLSPVQVVPGEKPLNFVGLLLPAPAKDEPERSP